MRRWLLACALLGSLAACAPATRPAPQQFSAVTELQGERVAVVVTNLGPSDLWIKSNACPRDVLVRISEKLPNRLLKNYGRLSAVPDICPAIYTPPELWQVGQTRSGSLANVRLPAGTYTINAWAEPKFALGMDGGPSQAFQTVKVEAPEVVLTVP